MVSLSPRIWLDIRLDTYDHTYVKTTLNIKDDLMRQAMAASKAKTKTEAVELGLRELIRKHQLEQLAKLGGSLKNIKAPRRRRA